MEGIRIVLALHELNKRQPTQNLNLADKIDIFILPEKRLNRPPVTSLTKNLYQTMKFATALLGSRLIMSQLNSVQ